MRIQSKWKSGVANVALVTISIALTYLVGGYFVLRYVMPYQAPTLRLYLADLPDIVGQTSKRGPLPRDYIVILGDSYAEGLGDWMRQAETSGARQYHAAHVLQDRTGRDVVSLGRWGYGSAEAMVLKPSRVYFDHSCWAFPTPEMPRSIVVYLYEGNDLIDNYRWVEVRVPAALKGDTRAVIDRYLNETYGVVAWWRCHTYFALTIRSMFKLLRSRWLRSPNAEQRPVDRDVAPEAESVASANNSASSDVASMRVLLGPSIHLTDRQRELASMVFSASLSWLRRHFPDTPVLVAYLPSPAAVYRHPGTMMRIREGNSDVSRKAAEVYAGSQRFCEQFRALSAEQGAGFLDTRPALRAAAAVRPVHGPDDWDHFNEAGYRALGEALARAIETPRDGGCVDWDGMR